MFQLMSWSWHPLVSGPRRLQLKLPQDVVVVVEGVVSVVAVVVINFRTFRRQKRSHL